MERASGRVELGLGAGPFTVATTAEGALRYAPTITLAGLPAPSSLGPYAVYVVWAATPSMDRVRRLGVATAGRTRLDAIDFDKFVILVSAERSATVREPLGRIVLRGMSPSTRLQPPELIQFSLGAVRDTTPAGSRDTTGHGHAAHAGAATAGDSSVRWTTVPMPKGLTMLPAEMALRPTVAPYLPRAGSVAATPVRSREVVRLANGDTLRLIAGLVTRTFKGRHAHDVRLQRPASRAAPAGAAGRRGGRGVRRTRWISRPPSTGTACGSTTGSTAFPISRRRRCRRAESFTYRVRFPDAGIYWYHPHVREDIQQDLGLYGNMLVRSPRPTTSRPRIARRSSCSMTCSSATTGSCRSVRPRTTHALMGRFGNVFLVNGEPRYALSVERGEVVRFFLTNVSNTRTFNLSFPGARMKVVASDVGNYEREEWVESVVIAPAERYVVHVRFDRPGDVPLVNRVHATRPSVRPLPPGDGHVRRGVRRERARSHAEPRRVVRDAAHGHRDERRASRAYGVWRANAPADKTLVLDDRDARTCRSSRGRLMQLDSIYFTPVEWSGTMPSMNWAATGDQVRWILRDPVDGQGEHGHRLELQARRRGEGASRQRAAVVPRACSTRSTFTASAFSCSR